MEDAEEEDRLCFSLCLSGRKWLANSVGGVRRCRGDWAEFTIEWVTRSTLGVVWIEDLFGDDGKCDWYDLLSTLLRIREISESLLIASSGSCFYNHKNTKNWNKNLKSFQKWQVIWILVYNRCKDGLTVNATVFYTEQTIRAARPTGETLRELMNLLRWLMVDDDGTSEPARYALL